MGNIFCVEARAALIRGDINFVTDPIYMALMAPGFEPAPWASPSWADIQAHEASGSGYTAGGQALTGRSIEHTNIRTVFRANDVTWRNSTVAAVGAVLYKNTGDPTTSPVIGYIDFDGRKSTVFGAFTVLVDDALGVLYFAPALGPAPAPCSPPETPKKKPWWRRLFG